MSKITSHCDRLAFYEPLVTSWELLLNYLIYIIFIVLLVFITSFCMFWGKKRKQKNQTWLLNKHTFCYLQCSPTNHKGLSSEILCYESCRRSGMEILYSARLSSKLKGEPNPVYVAFILVFGRSVRKQQLRYCIKYPKTIWKMVATVFHLMKTKSSLKTPLSLFLDCQIRVFSQFLWETIMDM